MRVGKQSSAQLSEHAVAMYSSCAYWWFSLPTLLLLLLLMMTINQPGAPLARALALARLARLPTQPFAIASPLLCRLPQGLQLWAPLMPPHVAA